MIINGVEKEKKMPLSIESLLTLEAIETSRVVVEVNGKIILKEAFATHFLNQKDTIEIIGFVGGG